MLFYLFAVLEEIQNSGSAFSPCSRDMALIKKMSSMGCFHSFRSLINYSLASSPRLAELSQLSLFATS